MENFIKQNWFKLGVLILVFGFGLFYFLNIFPSQDFYKKVMECRKTGEEYRINEIKENPTISFFSPKYAYDKKLNACLYSGGFFDTSIKKQNITKYIKNLNTNNEIVGSTYIDGQKMFGSNNSEFEKKEQELFK